MSSVASAARKPGLLQIVDWRLVAAISLPLWAFLIGYIVAKKSTPPEPVEVAVLAGPNEQIEPLPAKPQAAEGVETIPAPREIVVRTEVVTVPLLVPVLGPSEPIAVAPQPVAEPMEFALPASEVLPADRCKTFDTKIRFHPSLPDAATEAKNSKKMILVLHISGNFDDPGFT